MLMSVLAIGLTAAAGGGGGGTALHQSQRQAKQRSECLLTFSPLR